jgi:hypothetical protein
MSNSHWDDISVKVDDSCPIATRDIGVNLKNRQNAIDTAGYGPLNPTKPNNEFWDAKAERWNVTADDARGQKCGNCAAFIKTKKMLGCIDEGLGNESGNAAWDVINAGDLGYCESFDFKCASSRTCDAWIVGGPITEEKENNMEEKSLEDMYSELLAIEEKSMEDTYLELLAIEEKTSSIVVPNRRGSSLNPSKRSRMPVYDEGEEDDEPEEDMLYDEEYVGDDEDDKAMMRPSGAGSPRDASDRQRGQQFMNWASGRSPSGTNVHPTSVGNMDIGDSGRRNVANSRMTDLMRNRSWTNPSPRTGVGSRATAINTGPPARPKNIAQAPLPTQGYSPKKKKPRDWGSDNNAQLISGATSGFNDGAKSAWDEEAYYEYEYDFDMKKLPIDDPSPSRRPVRGTGNPGAPKPTTRSSGPSPDARSGASNASKNRSFRQFGDHLNARDVSGPGQAGTAERRQAGLKKYVGKVVINAAGPASGAPIGDNRSTNKPQYAARVTKNTGSPTAAAERQTRSRAAGSPTAAAERQKRSTTYGPTGGAQPRPTRGPGNPGAPKPRPTRGSGNPGPKVNQQRSLATAGDYFSGRSGDPRANAQQQAARGRGRVSKFGRDVIGDGSSLPGADRKGPQPKPGKLNSVNPRIDRSDPPRQRPLALFQAVPSQKKPSQGFGKFGKPKTFSGSPGAGGPRERINPSVRSFAGKSYDQGYDEYDEYDEYENYLYQKSYDQGYDEYDEYIDFKGMTDAQAAGLREAGNYFSGRNVGGSTFGSADTMASRGAVRRSAALQKFGSEGPKRGASRPAMMNKPNTQSRTGSADTAAARIGGFTSGSRFTYGKASDEEMYWDDEDEMAIPPDEDSKGMTDEQAAGLRAAGQYFGDKDKGKGRIQKFYSDTQSMGKATADLYGGNGISKPRPIRGPGARPNTPVGGGRGLNPGNPGPNKRPNTTMPNRPGNRAPGGASPNMNNNKPRTVAPGRTGSADSMSRPNSLAGSLSGRQDNNQTGPKFFGRRLW